MAVAASKRALLVAEMMMEVEGGGMAEGRCSSGQQGYRLVRLVRPFAFPSPGIVAAGLPLPCASEGKPTRLNGAAPVIQPSLVLCLKRLNPRRFEDDKLTTVTARQR